VVQGSAQTTSSDSNLQKVIETQGAQLQLGESLINGQRNEIESLNKQKKALQIGLGASIVGIIVFDYSITL